MVVRGAAGEEEAAPHLQPEVADRRLVVPRGQMPGWLAAVSRLNPLTLTVDAWRGALLHGKMPAFRSLLLLAALAAALFAFALSRMRAAGRY